MSYKDFTGLYSALSYIGGAQIESMVGNIDADVVEGSL